jgi:hypothetical protein
MLIHVLGSAAPVGIIIASSNAAPAPRVIRNRWNFGFIGFPQ